MNCNVVKDLIPLYIDGCCSVESEKIVKEHIESCSSCRKLLEDMKMPSDIVAESDAPIIFSKLNDWKASILQSALLFISFVLITIGVALEANTPSGLLNDYWAFNLVIPTTGFMLSLANWYFVRIYKSRKIFSTCSLITTLGITICSCIWAMFHYEINLVKLFAECSFTHFFGVLRTFLYLNILGISLTVVFCILSKTLSDKYAKMLGKE